MLWCGMAQTEILHMRVTDNIVQLLDELRKVDPDLPSRTEMAHRPIRRPAEHKPKVNK